MNYKARYNRIKDRVSSMSVTEKAELVCGLKGPSSGDGTVSCRTAAEDASESLVRMTESDIAYPSQSMLACSFDTDTVKKAASIPQPLSR